MVASRARHHGGPPAALGGSGGLRECGGRDHAARRRVAAPDDTLNLGLHVGDRSADVVVNRTRAAAAFGVGLETTVFARQVHGVSASLVGPGGRGRGSTTEDDAVPDTDILVTTSPGVTLVIMVADCVPLALVDPAAGVLAAVHAGWRGTAAGAAPAALRAMTDRGARPDRVRAFLGPAVAPDRYQVDATVHAALGAPWARRAWTPRWPTPTVRVTGWSTSSPPNRQQLVGSGIRPEHIVQSGVTTDDAALFSDRATRPCGRFALMAGCSTDPPLGRSRAGSAVAWDRPAAGHPSTCDAAPPDQFRYDGVVVDPATASVTCTYSTTDHTFAERFTFGTAGEWDDPAVRAAVRVLFLVAGVSYYKRRPPRSSTSATSPPRRPSAPSSPGSTGTAWPSSPTATASTCGAPP